MSARQSKLLLEWTKLLAVTNVYLHREVRFADPVGDFSFNAKRIPRAAFIRRLYGYPLDGRPWSRTNSLYSIGRGGRGKVVGRGSVYRFFSYSVQLHIVRSLWLHSEAHYGFPIPCRIPHPMSDSPSHVGFPVSWQIQGPMADSPINGAVFVARSENIKLSRAERECKACREQSW